MVECDKHVHPGFGAANALIRDVQLIARVAALYEGGILTVAEHAVSGSLETFGDNRANGVYSLSGCADDFERDAGHRANTNLPASKHPPIFCPKLLLPPPDRRARLRS